MKDFKKGDYVLSISVPRAARDGLGIVLKSKHAPWDNRFLVRYVRRKESVWEWGYRLRRANLLEVLAWVSSEPA